MKMLKKITLYCTALLSITTHILPCATCLTKLTQKDKPFFIRHLSMQKTSTKETTASKNDKKDIKTPLKTAMK